jgi:hypothetical protein
MINSASTTTDFKTDDNADTPGSISDDHDMLGEEGEDSDVKDVEGKEEEEDGDDESGDTELSKIEIRLVHFCSTLLLEQRYLTSYTTPSSSLHYTTSLHYTKLYYCTTLSSTKQCSNVSAETISPCRIV